MDCAVLMHMNLSLVIIIRWHVYRCVPTQCTHLTFLSLHPFLCVLTHFARVCVSYDSGWRKNITPHLLFLLQKEIFLRCMLSLMIFSWNNPFRGYDKSTLFLILVSNCSFIWSTRHSLFYNIGPSLPVSTFLQFLIFSWLESLPFVLLLWKVFQFLLYSYFDISSYFTEPCDFWFG